MSLVGVLFAVTLLIVLIYKRINLIPASMICVLILSLTSGVSYMGLMKNHYAISLSGFIAKYFLVFVSSALFGRVMEETLLVAAFSKMIGKAFGDRNAVYGAMLATAILSYGGVSVFVIVFTVYPIFLATFQKADLPRKLIPACIMSSSCTFALGMLPGGAQLNNIIPAQYLGTSPLAAPVVGVICSIVSIVFLFLYFRYEFSKARKSGEHFQADEKILQRISRFHEDAGIASWLSLLPMALIIILINVFNLDIFYAMIAGTALAFVIGGKNLPNKLQTLNEGAKSAGMAMVMNAASVGFGGAVLACSGARTILEWIVSWPVNPIISLSAAASLAAGITGSGGGGTDVAMGMFANQYLAMGVQPDILHRIVAMSALGLSCLPHNGMLITIMDISGYSAKQCYKYIFISTVISSLICLMLADLLGCFFYPIY